jgi:predicted transcriptional regulator
MSTLELKNILIHKISSINDVSFLNAIRTIIDTKTEGIIYETSSLQKAKISEGINQIEKGESFSNEQVESEIDKWLSEE